jgi:SseB protein N-terminal domain
MKYPGQELVLCWSHPIATPRRIMFKPHNELEERLQAVHQGEIVPEDFVRYLMDTQVFMPVKDDKNPIKGFQRSTHADPMVIEDEEGTRVLILFSSPERGKPFLEDFPDYHGGLLTEFSWILRRLGGGLGISLNPSEEIGFDFDPEQVESLIASLPPEA